MPTITSRQHTIVKTFRRVARGDRDLAVLDGWHLLGEAIHSGTAIRTVAHVSGDRDADARELLRRVAARHADIVEVSPAVMHALSPVRTPTGVVAIVERRTTSLPTLLTPAPALVVLAVDMQDPGNVGAAIRSAEAGGASGVIFAGVSADPWQWKALRAAMGSTLRLPTLGGVAAEAAAGALRRAGLGVLAAVPRGGTEMHAVDLRRPVAIAIGGEGGGLSQPLIALADARISIPMSPHVESLNAAVAAALFVYEARRQRREVR